MKYENRVLTRFKKLSLPFCFCVMIALHGCAFGTRYVDLSYPPKNPAENGGGIAHAAPASVAGTQQIVLLPFEDRRLRKEKIGDVLNGYGMKTAKVVASNDVGKWVNDAIALELEKAGYQVKRAEKNPETSAGLVLSGEILRVFCTAYLSYEGEVSFRTTVKRNGKEILEKTYLGEGEAGLNWAATSKSYGETLSSALAIAISDLVHDIDHSSEKNPA